MILESRNDVDPVVQLRRDKVLGDDEELDDFMGMEDEEDDGQTVDDLETAEDGEFWYCIQSAHERLSNAYYEHFF